MMELKFIFTYRINSRTGGIKLMKKLDKISQYHTYSYVRYQIEMLGEFFQVSLHLGVMWVTRVLFGYEFKIWQF